jgi:hypothetical protein
MNQVQASYTQAEQNPKMAVTASHHEVFSESIHSEEATGVAVTLRPQKISRPHPHPPRSVFKFDPTRALTP